MSQQVANRPGPGPGTIVASYVLAGPLSATAFRATHASGLPIEAAIRFVAGPVDLACPPAQLGHPHLASPLDLCPQAEGSWALIVQLAQGTPLPAQTQLGLEELATLARSLLSALALLHQHGIAHGRVDRSRILIQGKHATLVGAELAWAGVHRAEPAHDLAAIGDLLGTLLSGEAPATRALLTSIAELSGAGEALAALDEAVLADRIEARPSVPPTRDAPLPLPLFDDETVDITGPIQDIQGRLRGPLTTVVGPAGSGKSRAAAEALRGRAVWYVDVQGCGDEDALWSRVARAVGAHVGAGPTPAAIGRRLSRLGNATLFLDNADGVATLLGAALNTWRTQAPALHVLVTSRTPTAAADEGVLRLPPLSPPAAASLLAARAPGQPDLAPDRADRIVRQLSFNPLLIELAASRLAILDAAQLEGRLEQELRSAAREGAHRPEHKSLERLLSGSWALLDEGVRSAAEQCAVFEGGFTLPDAEAVVQDDDVRSVASRIATLASLGWVRTERRDGHTRFDLAIPARQSVLSKMSARSDLAALQQRHTALYVGHARRWHDGVNGHGADGRTLMAERHNLLIANDRCTEANGLAWTALALAKIEVPSARPADIEQRMATALRAAPTDPDCAACVALVIGAAAGRSTTLANENARFAETLTGPNAALIAAELRGWEAYFGGDLARAAQCWRAALETAPDALPRHRARLYRQRGYAHYASSELELAESCFRTSLRIAREAGAARTAARAQADLAALHFDLGYAEAGAELAAAMEANRAETNASYVTGLSLPLAQLDASEGRLARAESLLEEAIASYEEMGDAKHAARTRGLLATMRWDAGSRAEARELIASALHTMAHERDDEGQARYAAAIGWRLAEAGVREEATTRIDEAAAVLSQWHDQELDDLVKVARAHLEGSLEVVSQIGRSPYHDVRIALRRLVAPHEVTSERARVGRTGFATAGGSWVDVSHRPQLCHVLTHLFERALAEPGRASTRFDLLEAGWPGQQVAYEAGMNRVYVALSTLRKMGMAQLLLRGDDGWYLDPEVTLLQDAG
jgi:predicted ATPase